MRSFLGISNHGPYVGVSISRRHGRRASTKHYARPASSLAGALAARAELIQAQQRLAAAKAALAKSSYDYACSLDAIEAHHEAERARIQRKLERDLAALDAKAAR